MNSKDKELGMGKPIERRDFLNGVGVAIGASLLPIGVSSAAFVANPAVNPAAQGCPSEKLGMRGSHPGSFENSHAAVAGETWEAKNINEHYDLIVVGAGISGLSAAYIYRRDVDPDARILIIDNHDDFGGHAKRNEFKLDGKTFLGFGGTMYMTAPKTYPTVVKQVVKELGINTYFDTKYNKSNIFKKLNLNRGTFFDAETFGKDHLSFGRLTSEGALDGAPLTAKAKADLKRLYEDETNYLEDKTIAERREILKTYSWRSYLKKYADMGEETLTFIQKRPHGTWAIGADALPAWLAFDQGYSGFGDLDLGYEEEETSGGNNGAFRYPDGNASIARLFVRKIIPGIATGHTMEDIVTAKFDYSKLDISNNSTRIRLSSTVVKLAHENNDLTGDVSVTYVNDDKAKTVTAKKVIWAGYHAMLPYISDEIPDEQIDAFNSSVRAPLVYTNVLIRNWQSLANLGLSGVSCPGSFFTSFRTTHPTSIGGYEFAKSPDEPVVLYLLHVPLEPGLSAPDQFRAGRQALLDTPFETFERNVREQLSRVLGPGGFDPARDIAGIMVNRWAHGYAYSVDNESGDVAWYVSEWDHGTKPWEVSRKSIGNIAIAGSDAASNAMTEAAIEEAHRAVHSFLE
jgi:spermidine dehydrogenase